MRTLWIFISVFLVFGKVYAGEWANIATSSNTVPGHICDVNISPLGNYDIDCPETNPEIIASGVISATGISVTGTISTTSLTVNGAAVTGGGGSGLGVGQTWQDVSASRAVNTSYQNNTGKPILVSIMQDWGSEQFLEVSPDNANWVKVGVFNAKRKNNVQTIVPDKWYYRSGAFSSGIWSELR